jgi:hypothetical protein
MRSKERVSSILGFCVLAAGTAQTVATGPSLAFSSPTFISPSIHTRLSNRVSSRWACKILPDDKASGVPFVIPQSKLWVEKFIVGLNLCPFAKQPFKQGSIRYAISDAKDGDELIDDCFRECAFLLDNDPSVVSTTLLLAPAFAAGLGAWGDVGYWMEDYLEEEDEPLFEDKIGVAFFHPNWTFEELEDNDPTHFERRAPYPTVSLLRKEDIGVIVKDFLVRASPTRTRTRTRAHMIQVRRTGQSFCIGLDYAHTSDVCTHLQLHPECTFSSGHEDVRHCKCCIETF